MVRSPPEHTEEPHGMAEELGTEHLPWPLFTHVLLKTRHPQNSGRRSLAKPRTPEDQAQHSSQGVYILLVSTAHRGPSSHRCI